MKKYVSLPGKISKAAELRRIAVGESEPDDDVLQLRKINRLVAGIGCINRQHPARRGDRPVGEASVDELGWRTTAGRAVDGRGNDDAKRRAIRVADVESQVE